MPGSDSSTFLSMETLKNFEGVKKFMSPEEKAALIEETKKRAYIKWIKIHENKEKQSTIYQIHFKRFYYKNYNRAKLTLYVNKQSIAFQYSDKSKSTGKINRQKYIITFKNNKLSFYQIFAFQGKSRLIRYTPFLKNNITLRCIKDDALLADCIKNYQIRLCKLFIKKCRENKVTFSRNYKQINNFGELINRSYYPVYDDLQSFVVKGISSELQSGIRYYTKFLRKDTYKKFVKSLTGHNSRLVTKLSLESYKEDNATVYLNKLLYCNIIKKLVPLDYIHKVLSYQVPYQSILLDYSIFGTMRDNFVKTKKRHIEFLKLFSPQQLVKVLDSNSMIFRDTLHIYERLIKDNLDLKLINSNNLVEIHDDLAAQERKIKNPDRPIKNDPELLEYNLDGEKIADMVIRVPQTLHQLQDWGAQMKNCIGGYIFQIEALYGWILGIERDNKIIYGIEIASNREIRQFRGKYNAEPDENDRKLINEFLINKKVVKFIYPTIEQQIYEPINVGELVAAGAF